MIEGTRFVDMKQVAEDLDEECAQELAAAFLDDTDGVLQEISAASSRRAQEVVRGLAHMLKGCSRSIVARPLEDVSGRLEKSALVGDWDSVDKLIPELTGVYNGTKDSIKQYLAQ